MMKCSLCRQLTPVMFPLLVSTRGPGVSVLADGCAQLAQDLGIPTSLSQLGIQVREKPQVPVEDRNVSQVIPGGQQEEGHVIVHHV